MKNVILGMLTVVALSGVATTASAWNWNDYWYCNGISQDLNHDRIAWCRTVGY